MKLTLITTFMVVLFAMASSAVVFAGGPVFPTEEPAIKELRPQGDGGDWIVPTVVGLGFLCLILCGGDNDSVAAPPPPPCTDCK